MWKDRKIPYTYHIEVAERDEWKNMIKAAIQNIEQESCLEFLDISDFMENYMKDESDKKYFPDYFAYKPPPAEYPDYLL